LEKSTNNKEDKKEPYCSIQHKNKRKEKPFEKLGEEETSWQQVSLNNQSDHEMLRLQSSKMQLQRH